jgi:hypothetical protein
LKNVSRIFVFRRNFAYVDFPVSHKPLDPILRSSILNIEKLLEIHGFWVLSINTEIIFDNSVLLASTPLPSAFLILGTKIRRFSQIDEKTRD